MSPATSIPIYFFCFCSIENHNIHISHLPFDDSIFNKIHLAMITVGLSVCVCDSQMFGTLIAFHIFHLVLSWDVWCSTIQCSAFYLNQYLSTHLALSCYLLSQCDANSVYRMSKSTKKEFNFHQFQPSTAQKRFFLRLATWHHDV